MTLDLTAAQAQILVDALAAFEAKKAKEYQLSGGDVAAKADADRIAAHELIARITYLSE